MTRDHSARLLRTEGGLKFLRQTNAGAWHDFCGRHSEVIASSKDKGRNEKVMRYISMKSSVAAFLLLVGTAAGARAAVTLTTAPFPGGNIAAGSARCLVTNAGTKAGTVTLMLVADGAVLQTDGPLTLPPGETAEGTEVSLVTFAPTTCRITVPSKATFRGSFAFTNDDAPPTVIPAQ